MDLLHKPWFRALFRRRVLVILLIAAQVLFFVWALNSGSAASTALSWLLTALSFLVVLGVVSTRDKGSFKLSWIVLILVFPIFGGLLYLLVNFQSSTRRFSKRVEASLVQARALALLPGDALAEAQTVIPRYLPQLRYLQNFAGFPVYRQSSTEFFPLGEAAFRQMLSELEQAQRYIFLEYFIVQEGAMWNAILDILKRKAAQGVQVRLLYDDMGCFFLLPKDYPAQLRQYGIECAVFNPFRPLLAASQNNRDHRKILSIDGKVAFTGGINLADEYINVIEKHGHWKDCAVMVRGKAAWGFTLMFLQMWELCTQTPQDCAAFYPLEADRCAVLDDGFALPYADSPMDRENVGEHVYLQLINEARDYLYICTPYLILDSSIISALCLAAKRGVDLRIITPHRWDKRLVHMTTRSYYPELLQAGVKIYEYTPGFMHAKTFVADDEVATAGTTNLDFRSLYLHFECGVWLYGSRAVAQIKEDFLNTLAVCRPITPQDCRCGAAKRLFQELLRLFAPLL